MMTSPSTRRAFSLVEMMCVLVALILLGAVLVPTLSGVRGNTRTKAGVDVLQSNIAKAREKAVEDGRSMRLEISADGKRIRVETDVMEGDDTGDVVAFHKEEDLPEGVKAAVIDDGDEPTTHDDAGWTRVATFLADGTCREDVVEVKISEDGVTPVVIRIRGVTGTAVVQKGTTAP